MRTSSTAGFDIWDAVEGLRDAFASRPGGRTAQAPAHEDVRTAVLSALTDEPKNGRQVMETIASRSDRLRMPSASAIYPMLQQLTDEGLVRSRTDGERTVYELTDAGRVAAAEAVAWRESHPDSQRERESALPVPRAGAKLAQAAAQVVQIGTREQQERAAAILDETRRKLYAILAED